MGHIVVTGGCGFIGSHLVDSLVAQGKHVVVLDNLSTGKTANLHSEADLVVGDINDPIAVKGILKNADACFHLAAIASVERSTSDWWNTHKTNLSGTINLFNLASQANSKPVPIIYASSAAVYGDQQNQRKLNEAISLQPSTAYGADKLGCELHARIASQVHGVPTTGLRFFNVYGPRQDPDSPYSGVISIFVKQLLTGQAVTLHGSGEQVRDFIYVEDVVEFLLTALQCQTAESEVFNACTGKPNSISCLLSKLSQIINKSAKTEHLAARAGDIQYSLGDPSMAERQLGIKARVELAEGLRSLLRSQISQ